MQKDQYLKGCIGDILVKLLYVNLWFVNLFDLNLIEQFMDEQDQYDVVFLKLVFIFWMEIMWKDVFKFELKEVWIFFYVCLDLVIVFVIEWYQDMVGVQVVVVVCIDNVVVVIGIKDVFYFDVEIGNIQSSILFEKVDYLVLLIYCVGVLGVDFGKVFVEVLL